MYCYHSPPQVDVSVGMPKRGTADGGAVVPEGGAEVQVRRCYRHRLAMATSLRWPRGGSRRRWRAMATSSRVPPPVQGVMDTGTSLEKLARQAAESLGAPRPSIVRGTCRITVLQPGRFRAL